MMVTELRSGLATQLRRPMLCAALTTCSVAGVAGAAWPAAVSGIATTLGFSGGLAFGVSVFLTVGPVLGALVTIVISGSDDDSGMSETAHLLGVRLRSALLGRLICSAVITALTGVAISVSCGLAGLADEGRRALIGPPAVYPAVPPDLHWDRAGLVAVTVVSCWLGTVALRSARRALAALAAMLASGLTWLLVVTAPTWARDAILADPLVAAWASVQIRGSILALVVPRTACVAILAGWLILALGSSWLRLRGTCGDARTRPPN